MWQPILSPDKFADWFNSVVPGAYRRVDTEDVRDMTSCGFIGRHGYYYTRDDLEIVRGVLHYEQLRLNRERRDEIRDGGGAIHCRRCGTLLTDEHDGKRGRPKEYCANCESLRSRDRNRKWRNKKGSVLSVN